jgi:hypothetical protein
MRLHRSAALLCSVCVLSGCSSTSSVTSRDRGDASADDATAADTGGGGQPGAESGADGRSDGSGALDGMAGCASVWFWDGDGDGHARTSDPGVRGCSAPEACIDDASAGCRQNWKTDIAADDCDDNDSRVHLGHSELCDGIDNDCDNLKDEGFSVGSRCNVAGKSLGACAQGGSSVCASTTAASCRPDDPQINAADFHDRPAPNGSWDWNCDGQTELDAPVCTVPCANPPACSCNLMPCLFQYPKTSGTPDPTCGQGFPRVTQNSQRIAVCTDSTVTCR